MPVGSTVSRRAPAIAAALLVLHTLYPVHASAQIELSTGAGILVPTGDLWEVAVEPGPFSPDTTVLSFRHRTAASVGARLTFWLSRRAGVEATVLYSESAVQLPRELARGLRREGISATLVSGTVRGLVRFPASDATSLHLMAGVGFLSRGGDAYANVEDTNDLAFLAGAGLRLRLAPHIGFRLDVEDYMTSPNARFTVEAGPALYDETRFQHYLAITSAVYIRLSGF
jgi:opacity protein-like surface antigen